MKKYIILSLFLLASSIKIKSMNKIPKPSAPPQELITFEQIKKNDFEKALKYYKKLRTKYYELITKPKSNGEEYTHIDSLYELLAELKSLNENKAVKQQMKKEENQPTYRQKFGGLQLRIDNLTKLTHSKTISTKKTNFFQRNNMKISSKIYNRLIKSTPFLNTQNVPFLKLEEKEEFPDLSKIRFDISCVDHLKKENVETKEQNNQNTLKKEKEIEKLKEENNNLKETIKNNSNKCTIS